MKMMRKTKHGRCSVKLTQELLITFLAQQNQ